MGGGRLCTLVELANRAFNEELRATLSGQGHFGVWCEVETISLHIIENFDYWAVD